MGLSVLTTSKMVPERWAGGVNKRGTLRVAAGAALRVYRK